MKNKKYKWYSQTISENCKIIDCPEYDPINNFQRDPSGCYALIRFAVDNGIIELAVCSKDHVVTHVFRGKKPQDIYHAIFQLEKNESLKLFRNKQHTAYLGKELNRAYNALINNLEYIQE